ncbi:hypothetical protein HY947_06895 [Candidatus Gottesmanbacteria bacterium]|nr:hypothetical protein [Candidatus Gottesmanbacteria bacterium]
MAENIEDIKEVLREALEDTKRKIHDRIVYFNYVLYQPHNSRFPYAHQLKVKNGCCEDCGWINHENEPTYGCRHTPSDHAYSRLKEAETRLQRLNEIDKDTIDEIARGVEETIKKYKTEIKFMTQISDPYRIEASTRNCADFSAN